MRSVISVVAIGFVILAGGILASAAQGKAATPSRVIDGHPHGIVGVVSRTGSAVFVKASTEYHAKLEQQRVIDEAVGRYGQWGPDLISAAAMFGQNPDDMYRVMSCESGGNPMADNGTHKGLFQFHPQTWASTPYGNFSINDGQAQIYGAAWMWSVGRRGEWECV